MAERNMIFNGGEIHEAFLTDLSQVMDHSYVIDEMYSFYADWCRRGELAVDNYCKPMYPVYPGSTREEKEDAQDNFIALRNAMINLYCTIDRATPGLDRRSVIHAAYYPDEEALIVVVR